MHPLTSYTNFSAPKTGAHCRIIALYPSDAKKYVNAASPALKKRVKQLNFTYQAGTYISLYNEPHNTQLQGDYLAIIAPNNTIWDDAFCATIASGSYTINCPYDEARLQQLHIAQYCHLYYFTHCQGDKKKKAKTQKKYYPQTPLNTRTLAIIDMVYLTRDLINYPANYLTPKSLADIASHIATKSNGTCTIINDDDILQKEFPLIYAVGNSSINRPHVIALSWGKDEHPAITLVGKGVCFDSGGLDLKPASGMLLMKKDMGGAAHALALYQAITALQLPLKVTCLIGAVENAVSDKAFRPSDIIQARGGQYVEIGDTDAEGRLVLADLFSYAQQYKPQLLIDFATLTGAARVAVGTQIAAGFTNNTKWQQKIEKMAQKTADPIWFLPLFAPYKKMLQSAIADISSTGKSGYGGAITAALFLQEFLPTHHKKVVDWVHFDIMAWNLSTTPGHPEGGEAMALRAMLEILQDYSNIGHK